MPPQVERRKEYAKAYFRKNRRVILDRQNAWMKVWRKNNPEKYSLQKWRGMLKKKYGITPLEYEQLAIAQGYACAICRKVASELERKPGKRLVLHVDHCHENGRVRGLLCTNCNTAIGLLKDNVQFIASSITYLTK